ncbi:Inner membrane protein YbaN [Anaerolineae bacterium]|nr:Inner membrane protein YbaN [Anaerolineae bacterium]
MKKIIKVLLIACGTLCVALGVLGMFVPVLPTTPFLLLAAICYARSSERFYHWLLNNRWFGEYLKNYREGRGIPLREKTLTIIALWLTIGFTTLFVVSAWWMQIILLGIAVGVTIHLVRTKTFIPDANVPLAKGAISSENSK